MSRDDSKLVDFPKADVPPDAARKRGKRAPITTGNSTPKRAADPAKQSSRQVRPRTAEDIANEQTVEKLALRIWAASDSRSECAERDVGAYR
jgi:hypothetical protein